MPPKRRGQAKVSKKNKKSRASDSSSESSHESPRVTGVIAGHEPRRVSPERRGRSLSPVGGLQALLGELTLDPKRTRVLGPAACALSAAEHEMDGFMASGLLGTRRATLLSALAARPDSNVRLLPPVAVMVEVATPQPHEGETQAQFRRRQRAEAAERRRTDRGGARCKRSKKNRRH